MNVDKGEREGAKGGTAPGGKEESVTNTKEM